MVAFWVSRPLDGLLSFNKIRRKVEDALSPLGPAISSLDISLGNQKKSRGVA